MACHLAHNLKLIDIMMHEHKLNDLLTIRSKSPNFKYLTDKKRFYLTDINGRRNDRRNS